MSRIQSKDLTAALRAPFWKRFGLRRIAANTANAVQIATTWAKDNTSEERWRNAADTDDVRALSVNSSDVVELAEEAVTPMRQTITFPLAAAASLVSQHFFIVPRACRVVGITEIHATAESTAATMTAYIEKLTSTTAPGSGTSLMSGTFDAKGTANTLQTATLSVADTSDSDSPILQLAAGDRLGIVFSTTGTELAGVAVGITVAPSTGEQWVTYNMQLNGDLADQTFFLANRDLIVTGATCVVSTKGTNGSPVNVQVVKDTSTNAPGAGTDLLTNNTNAGFNLKNTINTVETGTLTATAASLRLAPGDRLAVDFAGTLTAVAGVVVVVTLQATERRREVSFCLAKVSTLTDQMVFIADRNYEITDASAVWSVASSGATNVQLTRDKTTDAPGAGTDLLSMDSNAGWQTDGTANTPERATWKNTQFNYLMAGDRLSVDLSGTVTALAGFTCTVSLKPA